MSRKGKTEKLKILQQDNNQILVRQDKTKDKY